jgi:hypothetical protein
LPKYYKTQKIPSIQLSKDLIQKVIQVLETEYGKLLENQDKDDSYYNSKNFSVERKDDSVFETDDSQKFLDSDFDRDIDEINLQISTKNRDINVRITTRSWSDSSFSATSKDLDDIWVNGVMSKLAQTFEDSKNSHQFWHSKKAYLIYVPIAMAIASLVTYVSFLAPNANAQFLTIIWIVYSVLYPFTMSMLFQWMFPKIETKQSKQRKVKKIIWSIVGIVGTVILSVFGSYIYDIIK